VAATVSAHVCDFLIASGYRYTPNSCNILHVLSTAGDMEAAAQDSLEGKQEK